jgi:23S rRNA U2552 (ribose-2'-O)-methylase RlmE/FtsJ
MALSSRLLEPEWLDELPPADPRAVRSRADLRRVNAIMGNARIIARHLKQARRVADLGGGDGSLMQAVARKLGRGLDVTNVERSAGLEALGFLAAPGRTLDAIVANLFLHHLTADELRRLFALAALRAPLFVACEPRRSRLALTGSRLLGLIGCNDVTRHDAVISVRAGFSGAELSAAWPGAPGWTLTERPAPPFSHLFVARRDAIV